MNNTKKKYPHLVESLGVILVKAYQKCTMTDIHNQNCTMTDLHHQNCIMTDLHNQNRTMTDLHKKDSRRYKSLLHFNNFTIVYVTNIICSF